jgi:hypothetical protein
MTTTWTGEADMGAFVRAVATFYADGVRAAPRALGRPGTPLA